MEQIRNAADLKPLVGFTLVSVTDIDGDGTYLTFQNGRGVEIELLYNGRDQIASEPYGINRKGNRTA